MTYHQWELLQPNAALLGVCCIAAIITKHFGFFNCLKKANTTNLSFYHSSNQLSTRVYKHAEKITEFVVKKYACLCGDILGAL